MNPHLLSESAQQRGVFTSVQAQMAGYSVDEIRSKVRAGKWRALRRGVYTTTDTFEKARHDATEFHRVLAAAAVLALDPGAHLSHTSAATLHNLALLEPPGDTVHLTRPGGPSRSYRGVKVHDQPVPAAQQTRLGALPVVSLARAVVDCSATMNFAAGLVVAESSLHQRSVSLDELIQTVEVLPRRFRRSAERILAFAYLKSESPGESLSRVVFAQQGIPDPEQQISFRDDRGSIGRVDFVWPHRWVIAEFDGKVKYGEGDDVFREKQREDRLRDLGFEVVRITWSDLVHRPELVAERIRTAFARAARRRMAG